MPRPISEYVDTGKVRVVRRDFPLPQHKYARLAARYANAAGLIGKYDAAFDQIMSMPSAWKQDGDVEAPLASVLSPEDMEKVRRLLKDNPEPEESMLRDRAAGADDHVEPTPSVVIVANGKDTRFQASSPFPSSRAIWTKFCRNDDPDNRVPAQPSDRADAGAIDYCETCFRGGVDQAQPACRKRLRTLVPRRADEGRARTPAFSDSVCLGVVGGLN